MANLFVQTLAVVALCSGFALAQVDKAKLMETFNNCQAEINADPSDIEALKNKQPPATDKGKCIIACMMEATGIMKDGKYSLEGSLASADAMFGNDPNSLALAKDAATKCQPEVEASGAANKCDLSLAVAVCFKKYAGNLSGSI